MLKFQRILLKKYMISMKNNLIKKNQYLLKNQFLIKNTCVYGGFVLELFKTKAPGKMIQRCLYLFFIISFWYSSLLTLTSYAVCFSKSSSLSFLTYSRLWTRPQTWIRPPTSKEELQHGCFQLPCLPYYTLVFLPFLDCILLFQ